MELRVRRTYAVLLAAAAGIMLPAAASFPSGGPFVICADPYPHHSHVAAQSSEAPFEILLNPPSYAPGDSINVTVRARSADDGRAPSAAFSGYQIAAHAASGRWDDLLGAFVASLPNSVKYKYYSEEFNCVTHSSKAMNQLVNLVWKAPAASAGDIIFSATVLVDFHTFWVNVSAVLSARAEDRGPTAALAPLQQVSVPSLLPELSGCGTEAGCLLWPRYCTGSADCDYAVSYRTVDSSSIKFQVSGRATGFLSLGISLDKKMDKDETLSCLSTEGRLSFQHGYNPDYYNARVREDSVSQISIRQQDGFLFCEFVRPMAVNVTAFGGRGKGMVTELFDLKHSTYHIYLGWGAIYPGSQDSMMKHDELPLVSGQTVDFFAREAAFFNALPLDIQIHATLMLVAWMGWVSVSSTVARYARSHLFGRRKLCGQAAWFQVHRSISFVAVALVVASLVFVFVSVGGWTRVAAIHAGFGIASCALMAMQVIGGLCRPSPTSSRRPAFAWIHRIGGISSWLCAAVSSVLGVNVSYFPARIANWGTAVLGAWIGCQLVVVILFEILRCISARSETTVVNLRDVSLADGKEAPKSTDEMAAVRTFLTLFYICCMAALLAAALAMIWFY